MKIAIVGGGPAGLLTALKLARLSDADITIFEEHQTIGRPVHCAGIISTWTARSLGKSVRVPILRSFNSLRLVVGRVEIRLRANEEKSVVIDREQLDVSAYHEAEKRGVKVELGRRVERASADGRVRVDGNWEQFDVVVLADGMKGFIRRGGNPLLGVQYELETSDAIETVELWVDKGLNRDFFAWFVPLDGTVLAGTASSSSNTHELLNAFCKRRFSSWRVVGKRVGFVNTTGSAGKLVKGKLALIGDAGGQNKPTTGGGIFMIEVASELLARAIAEGANNAERSLVRYEREWRNIMSRELAFMRLVRKLFLSLDQKQLERVAAVVAESGPYLLLRGDMDRQSTLLRALSKRPALLLRLWALVLPSLFSIAGIALKSEPTKRVM